MPSGISPVARYIRAKSPSVRCGTPTKASAPCWVGMPATSTLSLTKVGTPENQPPRGSPRLLAGAVEGGVGHRTQVAVDPLGAGDGRLDHLRDRDVSGLERLDDSRRVEVGEGIVGEGMHARHDGRLVGAAICGRTPSSPLPQPAPTPWGGAGIGAEYVRSRNAEAASRGSAGEDPDVEGPEGQLMAGGARSTAAAHGRPSRGPDGCRARSSARTTLPTRRRSLTGWRPGCARPTPPSTGQGARGQAAEKAVRAREASDEAQAVRESGSDDVRRTREDSERRADQVVAEARRRPTSTSRPSVSEPTRTRRATSPRRSRRPTRERRRPRNALSARGSRPRRPSRTHASRWTRHDAGGGAAHAAREAAEQARRARGRAVARGRRASGRGQAQTVR